jgi:2-polyprenyl-6-methoxyphenol hydroxylase-like FAD-dependent oxidoreductase
MVTSALRTPVLVVGAGTVGSVLALELAHHGVGSMVVERGSGPARDPDLNLVDARSLELLRRLGLAAAIHRDGIDPGRPADVVWSQGLDQPPVLVSQLPPVSRLEPYLWVSSARLAEQLREAVRAHPLIDLREGWTFTGLRIEPDCAVATLLDAGTGTRHIVQARYLAGCDGAQSTVRRCLDVPMEQLQPPAQHYSIYFRSPDLSRRSRQRSPSTIIVDGITLVSRHEQDIWIGHLPIGPDETVPTDPVAVLRGRLGIGLEPPEVLGVTQWDDSLAVAATYRRGPAYLVGESAHRFHPVADSAGTGIGDAVDLGWKLAAVLNGWGGPGLLGSYELERRPRALMDRELLGRTLETRRRFGRLAAAGAPREFLAGVLRQEAPQTGTDDLGLGGRPSGSSVIWHEGAALARTTHPAGPGRRLPAQRLSGGAPLADRLGRQFTLIDLTDQEDGRALAAAAGARHIPMTYLNITDARVRDRWDRCLLLVRPDHYVAWRAETPPADWNAVLDVVTGHKTT